MRTQEKLEECSKFRVPSKIGHWLLRPLYARLWWSAMPFYWGGIAASSRIEFLDSFYSSALAGFVNLLFFPPITALTLSYGFFKARLAAARFDPDPDEEAEEFFAQRRSRYGPSGMPREFDPLDPASGAIWVGNPLNPLNPGYINRHPS